MNRSQTPVTHTSSKIYLDVDWTENGGDAYLARGAAIMMEMRAKVREKTGFTCSAGIAHNKVMRGFERRKLIQNLSAFLCNFVVLLTSATSDRSEACRWTP